MRLRRRLTALLAGVALALAGAGIAAPPAALGAVQQLAPAWAPWTAYAVGAVVTYNGVDYVCLQAHTSQPDWAPATTPALWQAGSGNGGGDTSPPVHPRQPPLDRRHLLQRVAGLERRHRQRRRHRLRGLPGRPRDHHGQRDHLHRHRPRRGHHVHLHRPRPRRRRQPVRLQQRRHGDDLRQRARSRPEPLQDGRRPVPLHGLGQPAQPGHGHERDRRQVVHDGVHPVRRRLHPRLGRPAPADRRRRPQAITQIKSAGGSVQISFGGWSGNKLGPNCSTPEAFAGAVQQVINAVGPAVVDFDIENSDEFENETVQDRILNALKIVKQNNPNVKVVVTFGTTTTGPDGDGIRLINQAQGAGRADRQLHDHAVQLRRRSNMYATPSAPPRA